MLKRLFFVIIVASGIGIAASSCNRTMPVVNVKLYFVDSEMMRLLPREVEIADTTPQKEGQAVLDMLIDGDDENEAVFRTIPKIPGCMSIKVEDGTGIVNIKQEMIDNHPHDRNSEVLTVYSIVNSLISVDGIDGVKFTVNSKEQKDFMGYIDMREMFIFDEYV